MAQVLYNSLLKAISAGSQGAAKTATLRGLTFNAIAEVALRQPALCSKETSLVRLLLEVLGSKEEDSNVRSYVREALSSLIGVYRSASGDLRQELTALLKSYFVHTALPDVRYIVVYWSNDLFGFDHVPSRLINLMAVGDSQDDISEEAKLGLDPVHHVEAGGLKASLRLDKATLPAHPPFRRVIAGIVAAAPELLEERAERKLPFKPAVCSAMLTFLAACIAEEQQRSDITPAEYYSALEAEAPGCLDGYTALVGAMFGDATDPKLQRVVAAAVGSISTSLAAVGSGRAGGFSRADRMLWLRRWLLKTSDEATQEAVAGSLAAVATCMPADAVADLAAALCKTAANAREGVGERYGALVAVGTLAGRSGADGGAALLRPPSLELVAELLCDTLAAEKHEAIRRASCLAVGLFGRAGALPLPLGEPPAAMETNDAGAAKIEPGAAKMEQGDAAGGRAAEGDAAAARTRLGLLGSLVAVMEAQSAKGKLAELAAEALGLLTIGDRAAEVLAAASEALLRTPEKLQTSGDAGNQSHFVVGRALVSCAGGLATKVVAADEDEDEDEMEEPAAEAEAWPVVVNDGVEALLTTTLARCALPDKPRLRAAGCVWLLCIVQQLAVHPIVRPRLLEAQQVFMQMLGDRSEIIQDVASRGVAVVYDKSDAATRAQLVKELVGGLASDRTTAKTIDSTADSAGGEAVLGSGLGKAPKGHGTSTYKELCSLVNDMGQPDLIYKFMGLASQGSMLNTKAGLSIGLGSIARRASAELAPFLPQLVPKLYRYQHDPTPKIQQTMRGMWQALVDDPKATVEEYFDAIMAELLDGLGQRQWRVREASALGLGELISGKPPERIRPHLAEMWKMILRAMDDIKETVRTAASRCGSSVANLSSKMCDKGIASPTDGPEACAVVIPYLLQQGLTATADEVREFALKHLIKISKAAGPWLRPHIPAIAPVCPEPKHANLAHARQFFLFY
jgi:proteasome component ECM29